MEVLRPLAEKLGPPQPGDWLEHQKEPGQTFPEYLASDPRTPTGARRIIYIQPLGTFTDGQRRVVTSTADFIGLFYDLPVTMKEDLPLSVIPARATRFRWGSDQVLSTYVLDEVFKPRLPADASAYLAFTASDLWPGEGWNFVFGQASLRDRVGVWSTRRFGDPDAGTDALRLCLLRTLKTGVHELGHMFGIAHCIAYQCVMNGTNNLDETDRRPLHLCPECLAKVLWATGADPVTRCGKLADFCRSHGLDAEADFYQRSLQALQGSTKALSDPPQRGDAKL